jgi:hypothetical protein
MRKFIVAFSIVIGLAGCGKAEREATGKVLANAYVARDAVALVNTNYAAAFGADYSGGWAGVVAHRESVIGQIEATFLSPYGKPAPIDSGLKRAAEIRELNLVTAELVNLALEPRGTWISYGQEMNSIRTRFDRALLALETGTREDVIAGAKAEAGGQTESLAVRIATAVAKAEVERGRREVEEGAARDRAQAEMMQRAIEEAAQRAEEDRRREGRLRDLARQHAERQETATPVPPPEKLGGGFPPPPKK